MNYELYRNCTLGRTLADALDDLVHSEQITPTLALRVLVQFDKSIIEGLGYIAKSKVVLRGYLNTYRYCDDVWTFIVDNCELKIGDERLNVNKIKIVACNSRKHIEHGR
jgi:transcription initiation factor TFIIA small subunit